MHSLVCAHCKDSNRVTRPIMVPYMERRSQERQFLWVCSYCDSADQWPVFIRSHPSVSKD